MGTKIMYMHSHTQSIPLRAYSKSNLSEAQNMIETLIQDQLIQFCCKFFLCICAE